MAATIRTISATRTAMSSRQKWSARGVCALAGMALFASQVTPVRADGGAAPAGPPAAGAPRPAPVIKARLKPAPRAPVDIDGDGILDGDELRAGSDPADPNSHPGDLDGDGTRDHLDDDIDGDCAPNTREERDGTDPRDPAPGHDSDGDGIPDAYDPERHRWRWGLRRAGGSGRHGPEPPVVDAG